MDELADQEANGAAILPDPAGYRRMIAKAIVYRATQRLLRPMFQAFQANVVTYTVSVVADRFGDRFDLERIWTQQDISPTLREQIRVWAEQVNAVLHGSAEGRMVSEWAEKPECWDAVRGARFTDTMPNIPSVVDPCLAWSNSPRAVG